MTRANELLNTNRSAARKRHWASPGDRHRLRPPLDGMAIPQVAAPAEIATHVAFLDSHAASSSTGSEFIRDRGLLRGPLPKPWPSPTHTDQ
jgi:hypothetical protein